MSRELIYLLLIFALLVIPRALQRFRVPAPITCLLFGIGAMLVLGDKLHDPVVALLSTLGISSLFLFAGLEVDMRALRKGLWPLLAHLAIRIGNLCLLAWLGWRYLGLGWQASALLALAALFVVLQAGDPVQLGVSSLALLALLVGLPLLYVAFGRWIVPHAPGSEFSLLVMAGFVAAFITYKLGVYYLVGAFIAGLVARLLRTRIPRMASDENIHALRLFASFFVPFYFFHAGSQIAREALSWEALGLGLLLTALVVPLRVAMVWLQRRVLFRGEQRRSAFRVSVALTPTLVFTLVLAEILHSRFGLSGTLTGALVLYTTLNTLLPSLLLRVPFDVDPLQEAAPMGLAEAPVVVENAPAAPTPGQ